MHASPSLSPPSDLRARWLAVLLVAVVAVGAGPVLAPDAVAQVQAPAAPAPPAPAAAQDDGLPTVTVIGTGGTIAGVSRTPTSFQDYRGAQLPIEQMVGELPELDQVAQVSTTQFDNRGSSGYAIADFVALSRRVDEVLETQDAVVVTTGTDTMEEFAYFLDLTVRSQKPVVVTGAMRPWTVIGSDAQANLFNSIVTAASEKTTWFGTVLMLNDEIHAAREVTKSSSLRMDTFQSPEVGVLGYVDDRKVRVFRAPARAWQTLEGRRGNVLRPDALLAPWQTPFDLSEVDVADLPRVELAYSYQGAGGEAIDAFAAAGVRGIVTAGTGAGGIGSAMGQARSRAVAQGVTFMTTTRTGSGSVYGGGTGTIAADNLNAQHARLFLLVALMQTDDPEQIRTWFAEYGAQESDAGALLPSSRSPGRG